MRFRVELAQPVVRDLRHRFSAEEVDSFYRRLQAVRERPVQESEAYIDPRQRRFVLRFFRFGVTIEYLALFELNPLKSRIRVIECQPTRRKRKPEGPGDTRQEPP